MIPQHNSIHTEHEDSIAANFGKTAPHFYCYAGCCYAECLGNAAKTSKVF